MGTRAILNKHDKPKSFSYDEVLQMEGVFKPLTDIAHYDQYRFFSISTYNRKGMLVLVDENGKLFAVHGHHNWDIERFVLTNDTMNIEVK